MDEHERKIAIRKWHRYLEKARAQTLKEVNHEYNQKHYNRNRTVILKRNIGYYYANRDQILKKMKEKQNAKVHRKAGRPKR